MNNREIDICKYINIRSKDDILIDVRDNIAYSHGTIPNAINIPLNNIQELYNLPRNNRIYVFCQIDEFSRQVVELLCDAGYDAYDLAGGYNKYLKWLFSKGGEP